MAVLTFRVNVPATTPATVPVSIELFSAARFLSEILGPWTISAGLDHSKAGYRMYDQNRSRTFIPEVGSQDNGMITNPNEAGWAPLLQSAQSVTLMNQPLSGPPYKIIFDFYNTSASALLVVCYLIVQETFLRESRGMLYELVTTGNPPRTFMLPTKDSLPMEAFGLDKKD